MLGKLLKHEFRLTARIMLPFYAALAALSLLMKIFGNVDQATNMFTGTPLGNIIMGAVYFAYGAIFTAVTAVTAVLLLQRFYRNLLRDEGYLMHTLPVSSGKLIFSKLICAVIWVSLSIIAAILSGMFVALDMSDWLNFFQGLWQTILDAQEAFGLHWLLFLLELLALCLLLLGSEILQVYAALTLGHTANSRRVLWSVLAYIGISTAMVFIMSLVGSWGWMQSLVHDIFWMDGIAGIHSSMLLLIAINLARCALFFGGTNWLMKHRLNLE